MPASPPIRPLSRISRPVVRSSVRTLISPIFNPMMPVAVQRQCMRHATRASVSPRGVHYRRRMIGDRFGLIAAPRHAERGAILYLHGGGFILGSPHTHKALIGQIARHCNRLVLAPDYRLAPEARYPAAVDDCLAAYHWLLRNGFAPDEITIMGDSAGGCLALATALRLQQAALPLPEALVALSPLTDMSLSQLHQTPTEPMLRASWLKACVQAYAPHQNPYDPMLSPVYANYTGLPRVLIQVGSDEILLNDARRLHAQILASGGQASLEIYPGMWHVFQFHAGVLRTADQALSQIRDFILLSA